MNIQNKIPLDLQQIFAGIALRLQVVPPQECLWVAVSGGLDSVTLLYSLHYLWLRGKIPQVQRLAVLHVDHALRGLESQGDAEFVQALAQQLQLEFFSRKIVWQGKASQAKAREAREAIYREARSLYRPSLIAIAHHQDDLAETIFQRIWRGSGVQGMLAMAYLQEDRVRPFLQLSHSQIQSIAKHWRLAWREDSSNLSTKYERNWIRRELFPLLESKRPGFAKKIVALAEDIRGLQTQREGTKRLLEEISLLEGKLFRTESLRELRGEELKIFGGGRVHREQLRKIFSKGCGKAQIPGAEVWVSCGWVLYCKNLRDWERRARGDPQPQEWRSVLGSWKGGESLRGRRSGDGLRIKARLQAARVPAFLRSAIPVLELRSQPPELELLLAPSLTKEFEFHVAGEKIHFAPSELTQKIFA